MKYPRKSSRRNQARSHSCFPLAKGHILGSIFVMAICCCAVNVQLYAQSVGANLPDPLGSSVRDATQVYTPILGRSLTAPGTDSTDVSSPNRAKVNFETRLRSTSVMPENLSIHVQTGTEEPESRGISKATLGLKSAGMHCSLDNASKLASGLRATSSRQEEKALIESACASGSMSALHGPGTENGLLRTGGYASGRGLASSSVIASATRRPLRRGSSLQTAMVPAGIAISPEEITLAKSITGLGSSNSPGGGMTGAGQSKGGGWRSGGGSNGAGAPVWMTWQGWRGWGGASSGGGFGSSNAGPTSATGLSDSEKVGIPTIPTDAQQSGLVPSTNTDGPPED